MLYNTYLNTILTLVSGMTLVGTTPSVNYIKIEYEDFLELDPKSFVLSGYSCFICPIPFTMNDYLAQYAARVYFMGQHKEDGSDKVEIIGNCITLAQLLLVSIPSYMPGIVFPVPITPVSLFDATVSGIYIDLQVNQLFNDGEFPCVDADAPSLGTSGSSGISGTSGTSGIGTP